MSLCVLQEFRDKGIEVWKISKVQFVYDTSETSHFINAYNRESQTQHISILQLPHSFHISIQLQLEELIRVGI